MIKKLKRAFTITELVIVIAVIAILAAVLIPTLSSVVSSSKTSADKAYVREMNQTLSSYINTELGGVAPTTYQGLMEALDSEGLCDASNPYLLAKALETEDATVIWYPGSSAVILVLPDDGYTITYDTSSTIANTCGNAVQVTDTTGTIGYAVKLCTSSTEAEKAAAELYNLYYGTYSGSATAFISSNSYATMLNSVSGKDSTWAKVIEATLKNISVGYTYSEVTATKIISAAGGTNKTITLDYASETLLAAAGYTETNGTWTDSAGNTVSATDIASITSELVSANVLTSLATMVTLAADTSSAAKLSGETIKLEVDDDTVVDMSQATITPIGTSYRKDSDFKSSTTQSFSIDFGGLTLTGYTISAGTFTSTGANYQDAKDLGNVDGGYAFTYGIMGSVNGSTEASNPTTYSNLTITDININLNGSTESIDGTTYSTLCDMAGIVCGFTYGYVNFENITVDGSGDNAGSQGSFSGYDAVAGIVGRCYKNQTTGEGGVTLSNCSVSNLAITGQRRAGGLIGYTQGLDSLVLDNCSISNVDITCTRDDGITQVMGGVIGHVSTDVVIKGTLAISGVTTYLAYGDGTTSNTTLTEKTESLIYAVYTSDNKKFALCTADNDKVISLYDENARVQITDSGTTYSWAYTTSGTNSYTGAKASPEISFVAD